MIKDKEGNILVAYKPRVNDKFVCPELDYIKYALVIVVESYPKAKWIMLCFHNNGDINRYFNAMTESRFVNELVEDNVTWIFDSHYERLNAEWIETKVSEE